MTKILLYGMQSSGASYVAWCMGSDPEAIVIPDLYASIAPDASHFDGLSVVLKVSVSKRGTLEESVEAFRPDKVILVLRDEAAVRASLMRRWQMARRPRVFLNCGTRDIRRMMLIMRRTIPKRHLWDEAVVFADYVGGRIMPTRDIWEIVESNWARCEWCRKNYRPQKWGIGGIKPPGMGHKELDSLRRVVCCLDGHRELLPSR